MEFSTERLRVWVPEVDEAPRLVDYYERNREHLQRWEPIRPGTFYTEEFWIPQLRQNLKDSSQGLSYRMVFGRADSSARDPIMGILNIFNVIRGAFQAAHVGYSVDSSHTRQGFMTEALVGATEFAFEELGLHRLMANYIPSNAASAGV
ncbi:MAG: GNAT family N-acetyltransferase, partial [Planctomycetes bacterium]|nr:GNAT family N-acetyltransferase [Planctomycetota bacterium]